MKNNKITQITLPLVSLVLTIYSTSVLAIVESSEWQTLDQAFGAQSLCEAYADNEKHKFERESCYMKCSRWSYTLHIQCHSDERAPESDVAELTFVKTSDGKTFSTGKITNNMWETNSKNPLRMKAAAVESYGQKFNLDSVSSSSEPNENDVIIAHYSIHSKRPTGELKIVGEGSWAIKTSPGTISEKIIRKTHTTHALGQETSTDSLLE
ncbi:MAG: hypothetical protein KDD38_07040 [Bdellovibrionales bacterium]|nr:hypothetical protein [Bdellovibrionales bacterium]